MPSVFLSYARDDREVVQQLAQGLMERGVSVWRDQEKLYAGQKWPKALGEAIASHDAFLLVWSKHSAASEYVELEWCTAVALKKTILPWLLDDTPLPSSITSYHLHLTKGVRRVTPLGKDEGCMMRDVGGGGGEADSGRMQHVRKIPATPSFITHHSSFILLHPRL